MKNLTATIPVNRNIVEDLLAKSDLAGYDIKASYGEAQKELIWVNFEVPADKVTDIANIEGEAPVIMADLRQAAKKYLTDEFNNRATGYTKPD